jgi:hypothetical protein
VTVALYRELTAGQRVTSALARAKRALVRAGAPPRAWSAWVVIGRPEIDAALVAAPGPSPWPRRAAWLLAAVGVLAIAGGLRRRT